MDPLIFLPVGELLLTMLCGALLRHLMPAPRHAYDRRLLAGFTILIILLSVSTVVRGFLSFRNSQAHVAALAKAMSQDLSLFFLERADFDVMSENKPATKPSVQTSRMQLAKLRFDYAHHLYRDKAYPEAAAHLEAATKLVASAACYNNLGVLATHTGDTSRAVTYFQRAIQLDPSLGAAHYNLAVIYLRTRRSLADIVEQFEAAIDKEG